MRPDACRAGSGAARYRLCRNAIALFALLALSGCSTVAYYWQGLRGQLDLLARAQPIAEVAETTTDPVLKQRLIRAQAIRSFASNELALPDNGRYRRYADLGRAYAVWNVVATPELSLKSRRWCFPVTGCINYRGYFAEADAQAEGARIAAEGDDVYIGGVPAYSTLGYFDDPVLSSFIGYRESDFARLLFHELAHQVVYVKDDTAFNESFAVAVEEAGLRRWLAAQSGRADAAQLAADAARAERSRDEFRTLVRRTRERLEALYRSDVSDAEKRVGKAAAFAAMRAENEALKARQGGGAGFDRWFAAGANNAGIAVVALYNDRVPQFRALLEAEGGDLPRFYARVKALAALPKSERDAALDAMPVVKGA